ncbi:MAG: sugar kinase [Candidatus Latescibacterota bacterium]|nr:sugar kinase [Candidatus Latescibacterota bacterium]
MTEARAFAPGNISGVFKIIPHEDPAQMHSLGLGFTVEHGVEVSVREGEGDTSVTFNGEAIDFPTVVTVAERLAAGRALVIDIATPLPLSSGFGLSGASALATAYAGNELLDLGKKRDELALLTHVAEVEQLTGLGDVCAQFHGGCLTKLSPGDPLGAQRLAVEAGVEIHYRYFSAIRTRDILADERRRRQINDAADEALSALAGLAEMEAVAVEDCVRISRGFAESSGLLEHEGVRAAVDEVEAAGGNSSMIMLGNAVFSTVPFTGSARTTLQHRAGEVL